MKGNIVLCALVASISLHAQASSTDTQNSMWSSWTNTVINKTPMDIYFGSDVLYTNKENLIKANSETKFTQKTPANRMEFIYDKSKNVMFSTVDNNGPGVSTVTSIKWKDNKPDAVVECFTIETNFSDDYGYDLAYSGVDMRLINIDKKVTPVLITGETCGGNLEYAKSHIPQSINK